MGKDLLDKVAAALEGAGYADDVALHRLVVGLLADWSAQQCAGAAKEERALTRLLIRAIRGEWYDSPDAVAALEALDRRLKDTWDAGK
jgi:uncharacterized membrane protein YkvA (DUF1232 family)